MNTQTIQADARLPYAFTLLICLLCTLPWFLNQHGFDFASPIGSSLPAANGTGIEGSRSVEHLFRGFSGPFIHTVLEWSAVAVAIFTAVLAFLHFQINRDVTTPVIGLALLCAGVMDAFHTLAADRLIDTVANPRNLENVTWALSRLFTALIMVVGASLCVLWPRLAWQRKRRFVFLVAVLFGTIACATILYCARSRHLPETIYPRGFITRPYDVAPLLLFLFAGGFVYPRLYRQEPNLFSHALVISAVPSAATQFYIAFGSTRLFDNSFNIAHFLKIVAYLVPFTGLAFDYVRTYREEALNVKQLEATRQQLAAANIKLEASEMDLERHAAELEIANGRLEDMNQLKTSFLSTVAHELRTPLSAIVSGSKIITKHHRTKPEVVSKFGETILTEGNRLIRLINDLLDLTKIEAGCVEWTDSRIDPSVLVAQAIDSMQSLATERAIELHQDLADDLPEVTADHDRLVQVLTNLIGNAVKHTPAAGTITVRARRDGDAIHFSVDDTGPGIPTEAAAHIFERFYQVRSDGKAVKKAGTGLGLSICREIVERHGGRIWVESEPGRASSFQFTIAKIPARAGDSGPRPAQSAATRGTIRVLLMLEDAELTQRILVRRDTGSLDLGSCDDPVALQEVVAQWNPAVLMISPCFAATMTNELLTRLQSQGVGRVLVYSPESGITDLIASEGPGRLLDTLSRLTSPGAFVLLVDDDARFRATLEFELINAGYKVRCAGDGQEALDAIHARRPDAMILDMVMPGVDGLTVLEQLRMASIELPILVLTAMDDSDLGQAVRSLGAASILRKHELDRPLYQAVAARVQRLLNPILRAPQPGVSSDTPRKD